MHRREILKLAALGATELATASPLWSAPQATPIIDTHIHLFDPTRPGGVPWPTPDDTALYKPALPGRYQTMSAKYGVVGAIAIEASSLNSDNDWLLKIVGDHPIMVGMVGDLIPGSASYMADLERLHRNPLFLGIRYGNLWDRDLYADLDKPGFCRGTESPPASRFPSSTPPTPIRVSSEPSCVLPSAFPNSALSSTISLTPPRPPPGQSASNISMTFTPSPRIPTSS